MAEPTTTRGLMVEPFFIPGGMAAIRYYVESESLG
jgi:hypothetical protein